jgi:hypothetical protein
MTVDAADIVTVDANVWFRGNSGHWGMSALTPIADIRQTYRDVRFVPKADIVRSFYENR